MIQCERVLVISDGIQVLVLRLKASRTSGLPLVLFSMDASCCYSQPVSACFYSLTEQSDLHALHAFRRLLNKDYCYV